MEWVGTSLTRFKRKKRAMKVGRPKKKPYNVLSIKKTKKKRSKEKMKICGKMGYILPNSGDQDVKKGGGNREF